MIVLYLLHLLNVAIVMTMAMAIVIARRDNAKSSETFIIHIIFPSSGLHKGRK
jgi:hypothetical protein